MKNTYRIEIIITLLSYWDMKAVSRNGRRVKQYKLSKETEEAIAIKQAYLKGGMSKDEYEDWCYKWIEAHDISQEDWSYLKRNNYLDWLKASLR